MLYYKMNSEKLLHYYIYVLLFIKCILVLMILREYGLKIKNSFIDSEKIFKQIQKVTRRKENIEHVFLVGVYLLLMYLFYPFNNTKVITVDGHTKMLLFATGIVSIMHIVFKKK